MSRAPKNITTVLLSRFTTEGGSYTGLQSSSKELESTLSAGNPSVVLIGGGAQHVRQLLGRTPQLPLDRSVWVPTSEAEIELTSILHKLDRSLTGTPRLSTTFIGKHPVGCVGLLSESCKEFLKHSVTLMFMFNPFVLQTVDELQCVLCDVLQRNEDGIDQLTHADCLSARVQEWSVHSAASHLIGRGSTSLGSI